MCVFKAFLGVGAPVRENNLAVVASYGGPLLILHGKYDSIIPFSHGTKLHAAAANSKFIAYDAGHNDCPPSWPVFWQDLEKFLRDVDIIDTKVLEPSG